MSDLYTGAEFTEVKRNTRPQEENEERGGWKERDVEIYESADTVRSIYADLTSEAVTIENASTQQNGGPHSEKCPPAVQRMVLLLAAVALGLLCVAMAGIISLAIRYNSVIMDKDKEYNHLKTSQNQLQTNYNTLAKERDQLQTSYNNLTRERDQLQTKVKQLQGRLCTSGWQTFGNRCYYLSTEKKTWQESRNDCQARGADLVAITSKDEQVFVSGLDVCEEVWIGLKYEKIKWQWMDGTPLKTVFWGHNRPYDDIHPYCAVQLKRQWTYVRCDSSKYWICEKPTSHYK